MAITCPASSSQSVAVNPTTLTMCVQGDLQERILRVAPTPTGGDPGPAVFVQVVAGSVGPQPTPPSQGTTQATITGQAWCTANVPVPAPISSTPPGTQLTALAWQLNAVGTVEHAWAQPFYGLNATVGGVDCCSGCISGSSISPLVVALAGSAVLLVSISAGEHTGEYLATAVDVQEWRVRIRDRVFAITLCSTGQALVLTGPDLKLRSTTLDFEPFSATFVGEVFGSDGDVVVLLP